jgi:hypothetical protein
MLLIVKQVISCCVDLCVQVRGFWDHKKCWSNHVRQLYVATVTHLLQSEFGGTLL